MLQVIPLQIRLCHPKETELMNAIRHVLLDNDLGVSDPPRLGYVFAGSHMGGSSCLVLHGTCAEGRGGGMGVYRVFAASQLLVVYPKSAHIGSVLCERCPSF